MRLHRLSLSSVDCIYLIQKLFQANEFIGQS